MVEDDPASTDMPALQRELEETLAPRIQILRLLGRGGMGAVFLARDPALKRHVVVKVLAPELAHDPTARMRFAREAESAAAVSHPNVVSVFQVGDLVVSGTSYFVMQHVEGQTLADAMPMGTKVTQTRAQRVIGEVAAALAAAHARGLVHRDIKPSNIMLEAGTERAIVLDFGISAAVNREQQALGERLTAQGISIGTPEYMSPEQAAGGEVTGQSDVYSLGVVAFELLAGHSPFDARTPMAMIAAHLKDTPSRLATVRPDIEATFATLVDRMLAKQPEARPAAAEVERALTAGEHAIEWPPPGLEKLRGRARNGIQVFTAIGVALLAVLAVPAASTRSDVALLMNVLTVLMVLLLIVTAMVMLGIAQTWGYWARHSGYPARIAIDVALDGHDDTPQMLNGAGRYASLPAGTGWRWLARRRWAAFAVTVGYACMSGAFSLWATGMFSLAPPESTSGVPLNDFLVMFGPFAISLAISNQLLREERRTRGSNPLVIDATLGKKAPVPRELVASWLTSARLGAPLESSGWRGRFVWEAALAPVGIVGLMLIWGLITRFALTTFTPASDGGPTPAFRWRADVGRANRALGANRDWSAVFRNSAPPAEPTLDTVSARELLTSRRGPAPPAAHVWAAFRAMPNRLPDSLVRVLESAAASPALLLYRRVAYSQRLPAVWYGSAATVVDSNFYRVARRINSMGLTALENAAASALALSRGDKSGAVLRAREIIGVGLQLAYDPVPDAHQLGMGMIQTGARVLREIGIVSGDRALLREVEALEHAADARRRMTPLMQMNVLRHVAANPGDTTVSMMISNRRLAPVDRWRLIAAIVDGACANPAEVRRGPAPARLRALDDAVARASDIAFTAAYVADRRAAYERLRVGAILTTEASPSMMWSAAVSRAAYC